MAEPALKSRDRITPRHFVFQHVSAGVTPACLGAQKQVTTPTASDTSVICSKMKWSNSEDGATCSLAAYLKRA